MQPRDYRRYLKAAGVKPIRVQLRTIRQPGDLEIVRVPMTGEHVLHRYGEAAIVDAEAA